MKASLTLIFLRLKQPDLRQMSMKSTLILTFAFCIFTFALPRWASRVIILLKVVRVTPPGAREGENE